MPSKKPTPKAPARKSQPKPRQTAPAKPPVAAKPAPTVPAVPNQPFSALFEPPASPAPAVVPAVETAASGEAPANPFKAVVAAPKGVVAGDVKAEVQTAPVAALAEAPTAPPLAVEPEPVLEPAAPAPIVETSDEPVTVRMGVVSATLLRIPLGEVLVHMDTFMSKLAAVAETRGALDLQSQMLATEGRCAPIYFTGDPDDGEPEHFFDGIEALAAAVALDLPTVSVIIIAPGDAGAAQNHLQADRLSQQPKDPGESYLMAVQAYQVDPPASPAQ